MKYYNKLGDDFNMKDMITLCGDNCLYCPRYLAKSEKELEDTAKLWYKVGWRDHIVSNEEIRCSGCSSHRLCTYKLVDCIKDHRVEKCNQCKDYPCDKIIDMLERTEQYQKNCKEICTDEQYEKLSKAYFEKEENLKI